MKYASLCTGIGGFDLGFDRAGMDCVLQCEIDRDCVKVLNRHWPDTARVRNVEEDEVATELVRRRPDVLCFGFPCQDLSVAGLRWGLAGSRSGLFFRCAQLAHRCAARWLVIENVPGLLSSREGRDMGTVLWTLGELGYGWAYRVLDAQWFGLAQRRKRVFIVGCLGDAGRAAEILFEPEGVLWDSAPSREAGARVAASLTRGTGVGSNNPGRRREDDVNLAYGGNDTRGGIGRLDFESETFVVKSTNSCDRQNHAKRSDVARCLDSAGFTVQQGGTVVTHSLTSEGHDASEDGTGRGVPLVISGHESGQGWWNESDVSGCLRSEGENRPSRPSNIVAFQTRIGRNGRGQPKEITDALTSCAAGTHADSKPHVAGSFGVRRLTPVECERLQGFPDGWTEGLSDSGRYRTLGNAVAVPVAFWIAQRIIKNESVR